MYELYYYIMANLKFTDQLSTNLTILNIKIVINTFFRNDYYHDSNHWV